MQLWVTLFVVTFIRQKKTSLRGFTLIEMSIVLVIIGLIVGGILVGQSLVYTAGMRKVSTELRQLQVAITTFRNKYNCLPGDCNNATMYWGTDPNCSNQVSVTASDTCNGNGDGIINADWNNGKDETAYALNQLSLAGFISGNYKASNSNSNIPLFIAGINTSASSWSPNIGYIVMTVTSGNASSTAPKAPINSVIIQIGATGTSWPDYLAGAGFNAVDAQALDNKIDDGAPETGIIVGGNAKFPSTYNLNQTCVTGNNYSTSVGTGCTLSYILRGQ